MIETRSPAPDTYKYSDFVTYGDIFADLISAVTENKTRSLTDHIQSLKNPRILELGMGKGYFLTELTEYVNPEQLYGMDRTLLPETILALRSANIPLTNIKRGDVNDLLYLYTTSKGLPSFDMIIAANLAIFLPDPINVFFDQAPKLLSPNGIILVNNFPFVRAIPNRDDRERFITKTRDSGSIVYEYGQDCYQLCIRK